MDIQFEDFLRIYKDDLTADKLLNGNNLDVIQFINSDIQGKFRYNLDFEFDFSQIYDSPELSVCRVSGGYGEVFTKLNGANGDNDYYSHGHNEQIAMKKWLIKAARQGRKFKKWKKRAATEGSSGPRREPVVDPLYPHGTPLLNSGATEPYDINRTLMANIEQTTRVAAMALINSSGQILVGFNNKRQTWDIPQGLVEDSEPSIYAAARELKEEVGIDVDASNLHCIARFSQQTPEFPNSWTTHMYRVSSDSLSVVRNCEPDKCKDLRWFAPVQIPYPRGLSLRVLLTLLGRTE